MLSNAEYERIVDEKTAHITDDCDRHLAQCKLWDEIIEAGWKEIHDSWATFFEDLDRMSKGQLLLSFDGEIVPEETTELDEDEEETKYYSTKPEAVHAIIEVLGDFATDYDVSAIADVTFAYRGGRGYYWREPYASNQKLFWDVVRRHDLFDDSDGSYMTEHCWRLRVFDRFAEISTLECFAGAVSEFSKASLAGMNARA